MLPSRSGILAEAISIASTSLQQKQSISPDSFLQCPHLYQSKFSIIILLYVINRQLKRECLKVVSTTFLLVSYLNLKESTCETWKKKIYFISKAFSVLEKIKF